jgi:hypothetical protein
MTGFRRRGSEVFHTAQNICRRTWTRTTRVSTALLGDAVLPLMPVVTGFPLSDWR